MGTIYEVSDHMDKIGQLIHESELWIILDVLIATFLTMLVGAERSKASKAAGMRTNMIVGGFTCLVVSLIDPLIDFVNVQSGTSGVVTDPIRVFQAIVVGVSFIGAGTIIKSEEKHKVTGVTTAATLLYTVGIGMSVALKFYLLAVMLTALVLIINNLFNYISKKYTSQN